MKHFALLLAFIVTAGLSLSVNGNTAIQEKAVPELHSQSVILLEVGEHCPSWCRDPITGDCYCD